MSDAPQSPQDATNAEYQWAPPAKAPHRRRRLGLWIGTPLAVVLVGVVAASLVLIAPGTAVAGVSVGGMTAGAAAGAIQTRIDQTAVTITHDGATTSLTGAELGAHVDAKALADSAYGDHPMWNVGAWFSGTRDASVTVDAATAEAAVRKAMPAMFTEPVDATVVLNKAGTKYVVTPAKAGSGPNVPTIATALQKAFETGQQTVSVEANPTTVDAAVSTETATKTADRLNAMVAKAGFYVGTERTVPVSVKTLASWLTITPDGSALKVTADTAKIQKTVDTLAKKVDRAPENGSAIVDRGGAVISTVTPTLDGRTLSDTSGIAKAYAAQLADGDATYALDVDVKRATTTKTERHIIVDLSDQTATLYQNNKVFKTWLVSTGTPGHDTKAGSYRIFAKVAMQDMGCFPGAPYCTKNVPWVSYFYPDVGFHGTYWHHNFGHVMSHGCVNLPIDEAKFVYDWAPVGTEVIVTK